jgi:putative phage-type endonuclease
MHKTISDAMGRLVLEDDVRDRIRTIDGARAVLDRLLLDPGIPQRTPAWYAARGTMITASDFGQALGISKFGTRRDFLEKKCGHAPPKPFDATIPPLRWGVMFEPVACALYSALNVNAQVHEFGLLRHPSLDFLGASPDGVTEDGVMLEIKCPWRRRIDGTVPQQYYLQIQGQLAVTGLRECDYFEVEFDQLRSDMEIKNEFDTATLPLERNDYRDAVELRSVFRGAFIERPGAGPEDPPTYEYPPQYTLDSEANTELEHLEAFIAERTAPDVNVIWWRVRKHATVRVRADPDFASTMLSSLGAAWKEVLELREDKDLYDTRLSEMAAASSLRARASSKTATKSKPSSSPPKSKKTSPSSSRSSSAMPAFLTGYAFIDDDGDNEAASSASTSFCVRPGA